MSKPPKLKFEEVIEALANGFVWLCNCGNLYRTEQKAKECWECFKEKHNLKEKETRSDET